MVKENIMGERMARVETKMDTMSVDILEIKKGQENIVNEIKNLPQIFVLRKEFEALSNKIVDKEQNFKQKVWEIGKLFLAPAITAVVIFILAKLFGI